MTNIFGRWPFALPTLAMTAGLLTACGPGSVTPVTTNLPITLRGSVYSFVGTIDSTNTNIGPGDCAPPSPVPPPDNMGWWNGIDPTTRANVVVTGFEVWSHTAPACPNARLDMYRGAFAFDVTPMNALSTAGSPIAPRISRAILQLSVQAGLTDRSVAGANGTSAVCPAGLGGIGSIGRLAPGQILTGLTSVPTVSGVPQFPAVGTAIQPFSGLPVPGTLGKATASVGGGGVTIIDVVVTDSIVTSLNAGRTTVDFVLTGSTEPVSVATVFAPIGDVQIDCKTFVTPVSLIVESL